MDRVTVKSLNSAHESLVKLSSVVLSSVTLAYITGCSEYYAYLLTFNAGYLIVNVPTAKIIYQGLMPLFFVLIYLVPKLGYWDDEKHWIKMSMHKYFFMTAVTYLCVGLALGVLYSFFEKIPVMKAIWYPIPYLLAVLAADVFNFYVMKVQINDFQWTWDNLRAFSLSMIFIFVFSPFMYGLWQARNDAGDKSALPYVMLKDGGGDHIYRLLFVNESSAYLTVLEGIDRKAIFPVALDQIRDMRSK